MNSVNIIGRLTRDPELRYTQNGKAVANMAIAVQKYGNRDEADFFDCVAFEKTAETIANNLVKGREVGVSGRLQQDRWTDQQGQNRFAVKIMVNSITFIGPKQENQQQAPATNQQQPPPPPPQGYQQPPYSPPPGYVPPNQGYPPQNPGGYPPPGQGYPQGAYGQPPQGPPQGQIGFQHPGQQPPAGGGYSGNLDDIPF